MALVPGLTLDGFSDGSTLITVMTSVEVEVVGVVGVVEDRMIVLGVVLNTSGLDGIVVSLISSADVGAAPGESSEIFEVVLLNLCMLMYLKCLE